MLRRFFQTNFRRFKRFIAWFPIIWNDEDWDESYLFKIMRFKISRMRKDMTKAARHVGYESDVRNMKIAEILLDRFANDSFYRDNGKKNKEFCTCNDPGHLEKIKKEELKAEEESKGKNYIRWVSPFCDWCSRKTQLSRQDKKQKEDWDYFCKLFHKEAHKWWN